MRDVARMGLVARRPRGGLAWRVGPLVWAGMGRPPPARDRATSWCERSAALRGCGSPWSGWTARWRGVRPGAAVRGGPRPSPTRPSGSASASSCGSGRRGSPTIGVVASLPEVAGLDRPAPNGPAGAAPLDAAPLDAGPSAEGRRHPDPLPARGRRPRPAGRPRGRDDGRRVASGGCAGTAPAAAGHGARSVRPSTPGPRTRARGGASSQEGDSPARPDPARPDPPAQVPAEEPIGAVTADGARRPPAGVARPSPSAAASPSCPSVEMAAPGTRAVPPPGRGARACGRPSGPAGPSRSAGPATTPVAGPRPRCGAIRSPRRPHHGQRSRPTAEIPVRVARTQGERGKLGPSQSGAATPLKVDVAGNQDMPHHGIMHR